jgi:hypothetical protein
MASHGPGSRRFLAALFDQQMWCLGRDIVRPAGNVLLDLGLCRYRGVPSDVGSTLYVAAIEPGGQLFLWGFGAMYAEPDRGGIFVRRYDFQPKLTPLRSGLGIHDADRLGPLAVPRTAKELDTARPLLTALVGWFAKYEHWIGETYGPAYRRESLEHRRKAVAVPAEAMADAWDRAAKACRRFRGHRTIAASPIRRLADSFRSVPDRRVVPNFPRIPA